MFPNHGSGTPCDLILFLLKLMVNFFYIRLHVRPYKRGLRRTGINFIFKKRNKQTVTHFGVEMKHSIIRVIKQNLQRIFFLQSSKRVTHSHKPEKVLLKGAAKEEKGSNENTSVEKKKKKEALCNRTDNPTCCPSRCRRKVVCISMLCCISSWTVKSLHPSNQQKCKVNSVICIA